MNITSFNNTLAAALRGGSLADAMTNGSPGRRGIPRFVIIGSMVQDYNWTGAPVINEDEASLAAYLEASGPELGPVKSGTPDFTVPAGAPAVVNWTPTVGSMFDVIGWYGQITAGSGGGTILSATMDMTYPIKGAPGVTISESWSMRTSGTVATLNAECCHLFSAPRTNTDNTRFLNPASAGNDYPVTGPTVFSDRTIVVTPGGTWTNVTLNGWFIRNGQFNADVIEALFTAKGDSLGGGVQGVVTDPGADPNYQSQAREGFFRALRNRLFG